MHTKRLVKYCYTTSERKWQTARSLYRTKRYTDCLFFCHLSLEMLLKGKFVEHNKTMFPLTHDLTGLAEKSDLCLSVKQRQNLETINTFNISGRYDDFKSSFYHRATQSYAKKYYQITKELIIWLKKQSV